MKILFDNQIFKNQHFGGISRYFAEIIDGIELEPKHQVLLNRFFSNNAYVQEKGFSKFKAFQNLPHFRGKARIAKLLQKMEDRILTKTIQKGNYDVFHPTYYDPYFLKNIAKKPFVLTVHDMIHELYLDPITGKTHQETLNKRILIPKAAHIIAVSKHTKNDILKCYPKIDADKITVIYHGNSFTAHPATTAPLTHQNYLLYVGLRNDYKNFTWLITSLKNYLLQHRINLICAGGGRFNEDESNLIQQLNLQKQISYQPIINDEQLSSLYSNAFCLLFPSLYEGFGIPILEAFACNCPVVAVNKSCLPEIGGNVALYFEANKPESLIQQLELLTEEETRLIKIAASKSQLTKFSWKKSVDEHLKIYHSIH